MVISYCATKCIDLPLFQDVERLNRTLGPDIVFDYYEVPYPSWNHLDFLWGIDANTLVYPQVMSNMVRSEALFNAPPKTG